MAKVAREMVKRSGIDVDQLINLLVRNAAAELTTHYYYTILRANLIGMDGETFKEDHRTYDLSLSILHEEIQHESWFSEFLR